MDVRVSPLVTTCVALVSFLAESLIPNAALLFDKGFERGIDLDNSSIEFIVRFPKGCSNLRVLERNFSNLTVFICQVAAVDRGHRCDSNHSRGAN